jgi:hypothetical protein
MSKKKQRGIRNTLFLILWGITVFLGLNRHNAAPYGDPNNEIWVDASGYFIYLPATFIYGFGDEFPTKYIEETGLSKSDVEYKNSTGKVHTKYPSGVAIMEAPFFLLAHLIATIFDLGNNGYSYIYHSSISVSGAFYGVLSMFILYALFIKKHSKQVTISTLIIIFLGTNYYYYVVDSPGYSHVYSFFLISIFISLIDRIKNQTIDLKNIILLSLVAAMIVLVRSINVLILLSPFILWVKDSGDVIKRIKTWCTIRNGVIFITVNLLIFLPQLIYNHYISNSLFLDSYQGENFIYLLKPRFLAIWFAPNNGLLLHNPLYILPLTGAFLLIKSKNKNGWVVLFYFFVISYVYASWWSPELGCGYGHRGFVEYLPVFSIAILGLIEFIFSLKKIIKLPLLLLVSCLIIINLKFIYSYGCCFIGEYYWDWNEYLRILKR